MLSLHESEEARMKNKKPPPLSPSLPPMNDLSEFTFQPFPPPLPPPIHSHPIPLNLPPALPI